MSYIAYKGFNKELGTSYGNNTKFEIGQIYSKINPKEKPVLCTDDGFHYCDKLLDTFLFYSRKESKYIDGKKIEVLTDQRFCEIEVLGNFTKEENGNKKNITTSFRIIKELTYEEIEEIVAREKIIIEKEQEEENYKLLLENLHLKEVREIQEAYPICHVGGSTALFLHGMRLKRWEEEYAYSDLDMIFPYFILLTGDDENEVADEKCSGNDFDYRISWNGAVGVDIRIDPKQSYEIIEFEGFKYKVSKLETILEAKLRYSHMKGGEKHKKDIYEICGKIKK